MKNKCDCYEIITELHYTYNPVTGSPIANYREAGRCIGTKEQECCSCGGDECKCDFYPEVRAKGRKKRYNHTVNELQDNWDEVTKGCTTNYQYKKAIFAYLNIN